MIEIGLTTYNKIYKAKSNEGFIIGGYTPLSWGSSSGWKKDDNTFLFSLTDNEIFRKKEKGRDSILCCSDLGPWFEYIGFRDKGKKNMSQGNYVVGNSCFENYNRLIHNEGKDRFFDVEEVEIFKIISN